MGIKLRENKVFYYLLMGIVTGLFSGICTLYMNCLFFVGESHEGSSIIEYSLDARGGFINYTELWFLDVWFLLLLAVIFLFLFVGLLLFFRKIGNTGYVEWKLLLILGAGYLIYRFGCQFQSAKLPPLFYQLVSYHTWSLRKECLLIGILLFPLSYLLLFQLAGMIGMLKNKVWIQHSLCYCFFRILVRDKGIRRKLLLELLFGYVVSSALVIAGLIPLFWNDLTMIVPILLLLTIFFCIFLGVVCMILFRPSGEVANMLRISNGIDRMVKGEEVSGNPVTSNSVFFETGEQLVKMEEHVKKAVETARSSEQLKVELITNVSHDLKTPLSAIIGYGELLKQQELEAEAGELVDKINKKSYQLREMLGDVMELSKVSSGVIQGKREVLNLIKLMEQALGELQDAIVESGLELRRQYSEEDIYIESDGMLLHQVFQNLFQNTLKYTLAGSRIYIQIQTSPEQIIVRIMNTASYEMRFDPERITDSFVRGEESRKGEGHGLGLAIASTYTNACGGTFDIAVSGDQFQAILTFERYLKD